MWCDSNERLGSIRRDITFQNFDIIIPDEKNVSECYFMNKSIIQGAKMCQKESKTGLVSPQTIICRLQSYDLLHFQIEVFLVRKVFIRIDPILQSKLKGSEPNQSWLNVQSLSLENRISKIGFWRRKIKKKFSKEDRNRSPKINQGGSSLSFLFIRFFIQKSNEKFCLSIKTFFLFRPAVFLFRFLVVKRLLVFAQFQ